MLTTNKEVSKILNQAQIRLNNSKNDADISTAVGAFGYNEAKFAEGEALYEAANNANSRFSKEQGELAQAFENKRVSLETCQKNYQANISVARVAFKNDMDATVTLQLNGRRAKTFNTIIKQQSNFYTNLLGNESWLAKMAEFGRTTEHFTAELEIIKQLENHASSVLREKGEAQQATVERDAAIEALAEWISDYMQIAKVALADRPQLLEKLDVVVRN
ncbi:hypothetical protein J1N10_04800 [Carboxylicivirga sp. A043]|uniref:hypothetical protein n=1 Tax=Carboxylicivirga litoralis TaxID=2816963 RepID=UPI0021CB17BD|nr:hypothetical protein [Carboxylicivirga sp. A043]MCU4155281.1 hypothetical protein [Carboxylicivirga sp. A043]